MIKKISFLALLLGCSWSSIAQNITQPPAELSTTPPAIAPAVSRPENVKAINTDLSVPKRQISYNLTAGMQYNRIFGTSTFIEPSVMFPVTKRFSGFASLTFVNNFGQYPRFTGNETNGTTELMGRQRYILNAGGNYAVNDRLNLTGQVWRDFSNSPVAAPINVFNPGNASGVLMRAHYKLSDNVSVSGGLRFSNGNYYHQMGYNPGVPLGY